MELPGFDYTKVNARWRDRIGKEDQVHARCRSGGYEARSAPVKVIGKITRLASPSVHRSRVLEYLTLRDASRRNEEFEFTRSLSPRKRYLLPPSSSKTCGWTAPGDDHAPVHSQPVIPGLYNWEKGFVYPCTPWHNLGYVTLSGVDTHPKKQGPNIPDRPDSQDTGFSLPTGIMREADNNLRRSVAEHRVYMKGFAKSKWNHPVITNDISEYGNAYIRALKAGPFNKTQILVGR